MNNDNKSTSCTSSDKQTHADIANYKNVMEVLVFEEIEKKIKQYPKNLSQYINKVEVATYALNRLPSLYASSMEGLSWQKKRALDNHKQEIRIAVSQGFAAVQRDLFRKHHPLIREDNQEFKALKQAYKQLDTVEESLEKLAEFIPQENLKVDNLVDFIEQVLTSAVNGEITQDKINELYSQLYYGEDVWEQKYSR
ncbi:MAG: late competence development ComFB family protein [Prochloraceae cyanobacterium]|nr:late competence development ComFB family protein [Prochloraceae cyanobacterium]